MTEKQANEKHVETVLETKDCPLFYWTRSELEALRRLITKELRQRKST